VLTSTETRQHALSRTVPLGGSEPENWPPLIPRLERFNQVHLVSAFAPTALLGSSEPRTGGELRFVGAATPSPETFVPQPFDGVLGKCLRRLRPGLLLLRREAIAQREPQPFD